MSISGNYSHPVIVNGFSCINCAEVDAAKKGIDPANPSAGPGGINARFKQEKTHFAEEARDTRRLAALHEAQASATPVAAAYGPGVAAPGGLVNVSV